MLFNEFNSQRSYLYVGLLILLLTMCFSWLNEMSVIRVCGCIATVVKRTKIKKYDWNRIFCWFKSRSSEIIHLSFYYSSAHFTGIFDVCSCMGMWTAAFNEDIVHSVLWNILICGKAQFLSIAVKCCLLIAALLVHKFFSPFGCMSCITIASLF